MTTIAYGSKIKLIKDNNGKPLPRPSMAMWSLSWIARTAPMAT
jgi:hypothetical protein